MGIPQGDGEEQRGQRSSDGGEVLGRGGRRCWDAEEGFNLGWVGESLGLEKTSKIPKPNPAPLICPQVPHLHGCPTPLGTAAPTAPSAAPCQCITTFREEIVFPISDPKPPRVPSNLTFPMPFQQPKSTREISGAL